MISERLWQEVIEENQILRRRVEELEEKLKRAMSVPLEITQDGEIKPRPDLAYPGNQQCDRCQGC